ncbi:hypothetical protein PENANT_c015G11822 [Penicillium antarcticum]|uniref:Uncharacterized protein n=1 Tax=Penicillium antarcticum TaxID=416450 RepID=A0A1V6Q3E4_9EURO|nr:hypothetical protein PENANT_c015G11822 [Penicillium antarcticum]
MFENDRLMGAILAAQPEIQLDFDLIAELYGGSATPRTVQSKMNKSRRIGESMLAAHKEKILTRKTPVQNKRAWIHENTQIEDQIVASLENLGSVKEHLGREKTLMESLPADLPAFRNKKRKTERTSRLSEYLTDADNPEVHHIDVVDLSSDHEDIEKNKRTMKADHGFNNWPHWTSEGEPDEPADFSWNGKHGQNAQADQGILSNWGTQTKETVSSWGTRPNREAQNDWGNQHSWNEESNHQGKQSSSGSLPAWGTEAYQNAGNKRETRRLSHRDNPLTAHQSQQRQEYGWSAPSTANHSRNSTRYIGSTSPHHWNRPASQFARSVSQQNEENMSNEW